MSKKQKLSKEALESFKMVKKLRAMAKKQGVSFGMITALKIYRSLTEKGLKDSLDWVRAHPACYDLSLPV